MTLSFLVDSECLFCSWHLTIVRGAWESGLNAGGCGNNIFKYATNPQYIFRLVESGTFNVVFCLTKYLQIDCISVLTTDQVSE